MHVNVKLCREECAHVTWKVRGYEYVYRFGTGLLPCIKNNVVASVVTISGLRIIVNVICNYKMFNLICYVEVHMYVVIWLWKLCILI